MISSQCPRCEESIRLPIDQIPDDVYAACPICRETFPASELTRRLPPMVELIGADGTPLELAPEPMVQYASGEHAAGGQAGDWPDQPGVSPQADLQETVEYSEDDAAVDFDEPVIDESAEDTSMFSASSIGTTALGAAAAVGAGALGLAGMAESAEEEVEDRVGEIGDQLEGMFDATEDVESLADQELGPLEDDSVEIEEDDPEPDGGVVLQQEFVEEEHGGPELQYEQHEDEIAVEEEELVEEEFEPEDDATIQFTSQPTSSLVVEEDPLEEPEAPKLDGPAGFNAEVPPMKVREKKRVVKKSSPIKTIIGVALGPLLALPLAGGILAYMGRLPDLGFYPADGTFNSNSQSKTIAAAPGPSTGSPQTFSPHNDLRAGDGESGLLTGGGEVSQFVDDMNDDASQATFAPPALGDDPQSTDVNQDVTTNPSPDGLPDMFSGPASTAPPIEEVAAPATSAMELPPVKTVETPDPAPADPTAQIQRAIETPADPFGGTISLDGAEPKPAEPPFENNADAEPEPAKEPSPLVKQLMGLEDGASAQEAAENQRPDVLVPPPVTPDPFSPPQLHSDSPELVAASDKAMKAIMKLIELKASGTATPKNIAQTYVAISEVGTVAAPDQSDSVRAILTRVGESTLKSLLGGTTPGKWLKHGDKRMTEGILLVGVADPERKTISLDSGEVVNVTMSNGGKIPAGATRVIALGKIIDQTDGHHVDVTGIMGMK